MNTLLIKKIENATPARYTAELNGITVPHIKSIKIASIAGSFTEVTIKVIVAKTPGAEIIIEGLQS